MHIIELNASMQDEVLWRLALLDALAQVVGLLQAGIALDRALLIHVVDDDLAQVLLLAIVRSHPIAVDDRLAGGRVLVLEAEQQRSLLDAERLGDAAEHAVLKGAHLCREVVEIHRRCIDDDIGLVQQRIELLHVVFLHAHAIVAEAVLARHAAANLRMPHGDALHGVPCVERASLEPVGQDARIAALARACMDQQDVLGHDSSLSWAMLG